MRLFLVRVVNKVLDVTYNILDRLTGNWEPSGCEHQPVVICDDCKDELDKQRLAGGGW